MMSGTPKNFNSWRTLVDEMIEYNSLWIGPIINLSIQLREEPFSSNKKAVVIGNNDFPVFGWVEEIIG